jgi:hypothetical protein
MAEAEAVSPATLDAYEEALRLRRERSLVEAFEAFRALAEGRAGPLDPGRQENVFYQGLKCAARLRRWSELDALAREAVARMPGAALGPRYLGEALMNLGRVDEAAAALQSALDIDPEDEAARALLHLLRQGAAAPAGRPRKVRPWPTRKTAFEDAAGVIRRSLLRGMPAATFASREASFMTLGSCFAFNLGTRLRAAGRKVHFEEIGEEVNSTFANRYLLEWVERGPGEGPTATMEEVYGPAMRERLRRAIEGVDVFVLTIGVAPCFFHAQSGAFMVSTMASSTTSDLLAEVGVMRTTTVQENADNIRSIIEAIRRIAGREVTVVLTVSPVPLSGTTEFTSAVIADCISKSTLRLACQQVLADGPEEVFYWPSFEIVRWLGAHFGGAHPDVYGAHDGNTRHVSPWLVDIIVDLFLEHYAPQAETAAAEQPRP